MTNIGPAPTEPVEPIDNVQKLIVNMLVDAGIIGIDENPEQPVINRAFTQLNWLLAQWARKRWLCYRIQDYSFVATGAVSYAVGLNQTININPRPDRLEYAFLRFLNTGEPAQFPVDVPIEIIQSHEDYSRIAVKTIGTLPWRIFYDPKWPIGELFPWPVPQPNIYEIHVGFKVVLPRFSSLQQQISFPPEYEAALNFCGAQVLRATYQMPPDPTIDRLAKNALNTLRLANQAMSTLRMPAFLRRQRAYDYRSDDAGQY